MKDEEFCMQLDSHSDVAVDWDESLTHMWGSITNGKGEQIHSKQDTVSNQKTLPLILRPDPSSYPILSSFSSTPLTSFNILLSYYTVPWLHYFLLCYAMPPTALVCSAMLHYGGVMMMLSYALLCDDDRVRCVVNRCP